MEEITLQLRQQDASDITQNGVFSTTLNRPILLEEGDEVSIKSATLNVIGDTIHIPDGGLEVSLVGLKYLVNYNINRSFAYRAGNSVYDGYVAELMTYANHAGTVPQGSSNTGDNALYWLANAHKNTNAHTPYYILNVDVFPLTKGRGGKRYGGGYITVNYTSPDDPTNILGQTTSIHIASYQEDEFRKHNPLPIPSQDRKANPTQFIQIKVAQIGGAPSIEIADQAALKAMNISSVTFPEDVINFPTQPITPNNTDYEIDPQQFTWTATIPEGDYTPQEMAAQLTDLLVPLEYNGATSANYNRPDPGGGSGWDGASMEYPSTSPFLETVLQNERTTTGKNTADTDNQQVFINASHPTSATDLSPSAIAGQIVQQFQIDAMKADYDGTSVPYTPPVDRWIGTNQVSISYDEDENKMKFDTIHFPIYTNSTGTNPNDLEADAKPGLQYNQLDDANPTPSANSPSGLAKAYSGIAFTAMTPAAFWVDQLGFSNNTVVINPNSASCNFSKDMAGTKNCFTIDNVIPGQTITEGLASLSVPVVTSSSLQYTAGNNAGGQPGVPPKPGLFARPIVDSGGQPGSGSQITTPDTVAIFGGKTFNEQLETSGYFLIDIANNFQTDFVGGRVTTQQSTTAVNGHDTMGIVGRYYTSNNFLTNQGPGNIVYTHPEGAKPQLMTDLAVRIKNPDGTFVSETILGEQNTVFLTIQRAAPVVNQPTSGSKKTEE